MAIEKFVPDLYRLIPHSYDAVKSSETEKVIAEFLDVSAVDENPEFTQVAGIPGSGKTTYINKNYSDNKAVFVGFDAIMQRLPVYRDVLSRQGPKEAFKQAEIPARIVGYELLNRAIKLKRSIVFEHSLNAAHFPLYGGLKSLGYLTKFVFIPCPLPEAIERTRKREIETSRHTPPDIIKERFAKVDELLPKFKSLADVFEEASGELTGGCKTAIIGGENQ